MAMPANTLLLIDWIAHIPPDVLTLNFGVPPEAFRSIPLSDWWIFQGKAPGSLSRDQEAVASGGLVAVIARLFWRALRRDHDVTPLLCAQAWFLLCFVALGISFYPYIIPSAVTIWRAAAPVGSLGFLLAGAIVMLPIILAYIAYTYIKCPKG
jgi:cytochrome bd-type quinol oxidase subunit 2